MRTKPTIAGLQREVDTLKETIVQRDATIKALKDNDLHVREKLSELLDAHTYSGPMRIESSKFYPGSIIRTSDEKKPPRLAWYRLLDW